MVNSHLWISGVSSTLSSSTSSYTRKDLITVHKAWVCFELTYFTISQNGVPLQAESSMKRFSTNWEIHFNYIGSLIKWSSNDVI
jgi:hypothetical protein